MAPVNFLSKSEDYISQRDQYQKGGLGRWYWDYRDEKAISCIQDKHSILGMVKLILLKTNLI